MFSYLLWEGILQATVREVCHKTFDLQSILSPKYTRAIMAQNLWE